MDYPLISDYIEAIKAAGDNFDQLKNLRPVLGEDGEPMMSSGNFAVVFKMKDEQTGRLHAVKCFLKEQEGRAEAYRLIAEELEYVSSTFLTPIKYLDNELFVDTNVCEQTEYPVLLMDWVEGQTLDKYIREHIDDQYELSLLAYQFSRLAMWLMPQPFAHGDLKPDNILVSKDGTLALVDYDGMYVPAMKGQKARELGSPDFRHPSRTEDVFDEHIDDFSLVSILLSLKAISLQPELLEQYGASDRLLFSENDYRNLSKSQVMDAIKTLMLDPELATLYSLLILSSAQKNLSQASFRLLNLSRPQDPVTENLSSEVTEDDLANAWTDEFGVKYSADNKQLLEAPKNLRNYSIKKGTKVICNKAFWGSFEHDNSSVTIPNGVKVIGREAFKSCNGLDEIILPDSVAEIGKSAFENCQYLTSITLSKNIKSIDEYTFRNCYRLPSITIPNKVIEIGHGAFIRCNNLTSIIIPDSVKRIGFNLFGGCGKLRSITVDSKNSYYDSRDGCNAIIETATNTLMAICHTTRIPNSVKVLGDCGFSWLNLSSFTIPENIIEIGDNAFEDCDLQEVVLHNGIQKLGDSSFKNCSKLTSVTLPESLSFIGDNAFWGCYNLSSVFFPESITHIGNNAFWYCTKLESVDLPNKLTKIGDDAFCYSGIAEVTIPQNVIEIGCNPFRDCSNLTSISVKEENKCFDSRYNCNAIVETKTNNLISACSNTTIPYNITRISKFAFAKCNLKSINIPNSVIEIGDYAFDGCDDITTMIIPNSVKKIGCHLFGLGGSEKLESITLPKNLKTIYSFDYFEGTNSDGFTFKEIMEITKLSYLGDNLKTIYIPKGTKDKYEKMFPYEGDKLVELDYSTIFSTEVSEEDLANGKEILLWGGGIYSPDNSRLLVAPKNVKRFSVGDGVNAICDGAFNRCFDLEYVNIPNSVKKIGKVAFSHCFAIKELSIPDSVIEIGDYAFAWCKNLQSISLSNGITKISNSMFSHCSNLDEISIPTSVKEIEANAFMSCERLEKIWIPESVSYINPSAFIGCKNLLYIFIPANTFNRFENILPEYRETIYEQVTIDNHEGLRRVFWTKELEIVNTAKVVQGTLSLMVCFYMNDGCQKYIPLCKESKLSIEDEVDLWKAKLVEFTDEGIYYGIGPDGDYYSNYLVEA